FRNSFFVEGNQMLVQSAGTEGIPCIQLGHYSEMREPVGLQSFPEIARNMGRDVVAVVRDALEFGTPLEIRLATRQALGFLRVALGESNYRIGRNRHGAQFLLFVVGTRVIQKIQPAEALMNVGLQIEQA